MRSRRGLGRGNTGSRQHIAAMYSNTASFGKICVLCVQKAPQSAVGEYTARTSCRQGAFSPSEALRSCTAHESCRPPVALPLRRGSCPSSCIAGSPFNGLALAQGCSPQRSADARHLPIPATRQCLPLAVPVAVSDKPPMSFGGGHSAHGLQFGRAPRGRDYVISTGGPTTECCAELGLDSRTVSKRAQNRRRRPQARPGLRQRCRKRPSKGRVPLGGTIGTPHPFPIAQKSRPQELTPGSALSAFLAAYSPSEFQAVLRSAPFRLDAVRFSGLPRLLSSDSAHRN